MFLCLIAVPVFKLPNPKINVPIINESNIVFILVSICLKFFKAKYAIYIYNDEIYGRVTADTGGGSAYLTSVEVRKPIELILFGPIKQIFFMFKSS